MHEFNEIDWDRVAEGLGFKIAERAPRRILFEIPGTEAAGGGQLLVTDNGGEINLGRIVYRPLECGPSGSIPYASVRNGTVGPYTMVYRIGGSEKAATVRTAIADFKSSPHPIPPASATEIFVHAKNAAVFVDVALNAIGAQARQAHYGLVES